MQHPIRENDSESLFNETPAPIVLLLYLISSLNILSHILFGIILRQTHHSLPEVCQSVKLSFLDAIYPHLDAVPASILLLGQRPPPAGRKPLSSSRPAWLWTSSARPGMMSSHFGRKTANCRIVATSLLQPEHSYKLRRAREHRAPDKGKGRAVDTRSHPVNKSHGPRISGNSRPPEQQYCNSTVAGESSRRPQTATTATTAPAAMTAPAVQYKFLANGLPENRWIINQAEVRLQVRVDRMTTTWRSMARGHIWNKARPATEKKCVNVRLHKYNNNATPISDTWTACDRCTRSKLPCMWVSETASPVIRPLAADKFRVVQSFPAT